MKDLSYLVVDMEATDRLRKISDIGCKIVMLPEMVVNTDSTASRCTPRCKVKLDLP